jgi:hypothetical protein
VIRSRKGIVEKHASMQYKNDVMTMQQPQSNIATCVAGMAADKS